jgi:NAD(P)-dependent dehydrogenase (short-subunit alcohol dehydrogenase family)
MFDGAAAARQLAADGYHVAILSSSGSGEALAKDLGGIRVTGTNESDADLLSLIENTLSNCGRIDALINSAGHGPRGPILELTDQEWHRSSGR